MRRILGVFSLCVLILMGCTPKANDIVNQTGSENSTNKIDEKTEKLTVNSENFHFVADWLTDTRIVFVEKDDNAYFIKTFDVFTGKVETLFEETDIIVDVLVHPSKELLLLHTTADSSSAVVKVITSEGNEVTDEISVASSELAIEWNDLDASLLLLTAFYEDWTFDVFSYNGKVGKLELVPLKNPFPQWLGADMLVSATESDSLIGSENLIFYDSEMEISDNPIMKNVLYFDTYKESLLTVQLNKENNALYTISDKAGIVTSSWTVPVVRNNEEWSIPEIDWLSSSTIIFPSVVKSGQLDELQESHKLMRVIDGRLEQILENVEPGPIRCSSDGMNCLTGLIKDNFIDMKTKNEVIWLLIQD